MIPIALDAGAAPLAVVGRGDRAVRRLATVRGGGAMDALVFSDQPDDELVRAAGDNLRPRLPNRSDLADLRLLWIADLPDAMAAELARLARSERVLVNVEDRPLLCDFHSVAEVRRGDLLLTVSTGGASPGLAAKIRARLAGEYGPEWAERLALLRDRRAAWRRDRQDLALQTDVLLQANGWLA